MATKLERASKEIRQELDKGPAIYSHKEMLGVYRAHCAKWSFPDSVSFRKYVQHLVDNEHLQAHRLKFPYRPVLLYSWGDVSVERIVQSINEAGYFSHFTAMQHHGLTEQVSKTIYFNIEQRQRGGGMLPTQEGIDRAFKGKCRVSNNAVKFAENTIRLLNGGNTGQLGVTVHEGRSGQLRFTDLERTLIDITVRPIYSGGVFQVVQAFDAAHGRVSVERLVAYLRELNYTYPYHQAIGYYLSRTGNYSPAQIDQLRELGLRFDFYVDYGIKQTKYVEEWRLHVPKGF